MNPQTYATIHASLFCVNLLNFFRVEIFPSFLYPPKVLKNKGFMTFPGGIEMEYWAKVG